MAMMDDSKTQEFGDNESNRHLVPSMTIGANTSEIYSVRFSLDGRFLAVGCGDGSIKMYNTINGKLAYTLNNPSNTILPVTAIRFRPNSDFSKTKNVLIASNAMGQVQHWHVSSGKCLHTIKSTNENQIFTLDYLKDASMFATAGKDHAVRIYDEATKAQVLCMKGGTGCGDTLIPGHSNRIFSAKFHPTEQNMILTGGWDDKVHFWDLRSGTSVRSFFGPHICGESLDIDDTGKKIITGSWREYKQLQLWDYGSGELIEDIPWGGSNKKEIDINNNNNKESTGLAGNNKPAMLYSAQFSKGSGPGKFIAAGGSGSCETKVFDYENKNQVIGTVAGLQRGVFTIDWSPVSTKFAMAGGDSSIRIIDVMTRTKAEQNQLK